MITLAVEVTVHLKQTQDTRHQVFVLIVIYKQAHLFSICKQAHYCFIFRCNNVLSQVEATHLRQRMTSSMWVVSIFTICKCGTFLTIIKSMISSVWSRLQYIGIKVFASWKIMIRLLRGTTPHPLVTTLRHKVKLWPSTKEQWFDRSYHFGTPSYQSGSYAGVQPTRRGRKGRSRQG